MVDTDTGCCVSHLEILEKFDQLIQLLFSLLESVLDFLLTLNQLFLKEL